MADRERIQKNLFTSHPQSTAVTLKPFSTPIIESSFIATEIKRLIAYSGGTLGYDDFAILCKLPELMNADTRELIVSEVQCVISDHRICTTEGQHTQSDRWWTQIL